MTRGTYKKYHILRDFSIADDGIFFAVHMHLKDSGADWGFFPLFGRGGLLSVREDLKTAFRRELFKLGFRVTAGEDELIAALLHEAEGSVREPEAVEVCGFFTLCHSERNAVE